MPHGLEHRSLRSDCFLQLLCGAEGDLLARLDMDGLAGGGVATHAGGAPAHLQDAKADDADAIALLQVLGDPGHNVGQDALGLLLGQFLLLRDGSREMFEGDGRRTSCFLRHVWPSSLFMMAWSGMRSGWIVFRALELDLRASALAGRGKPVPSPRITAKGHPVLDHAPGSSDIEPFPFRLIGQKAPVSCFDAFSSREWSKPPPVRGRLSLENVPHGP